MWTHAARYLGHTELPEPEESDMVAIRKIKDHGTRGEALRVSWPCRYAQRTLCVHCEPCPVDRHFIPPAPCIFRRVA